jgi:predicted nucleotidyltransferase
MTQATDLGHEVPLKAVEALRAGLGERLVAVVLFGSRARGDHRPESDWDLLVIAKQLPDDPLERLRYLKRLLRPGYRSAVALIARTPEEFEDHVPSLYLDIALDGRILYDPAGYAAQRVGKLRRLIEQAGLYRERTRAGDVWRWKEPPRGPWEMSWERIGEAR